MIYVKITTFFIISRYSICFGEEDEPVLQKILIRVEDPISVLLIDYVIRIIKNLILMSIHVLVEVQTLLTSKSFPYLETERNRILASCIKTINGFEYFKIPTTLQMTEYYDTRPISSTDLSTKIKEVRRPY